VKLFSRRTAECGLVALAVGVLVLVLGMLRPDDYQGRVSLLAEPAATGETGTTAQYGEVVSLALPALVELSRSPSVLQAAAGVSGYPPSELAKHVSVELVPASGLARLSVRAGTSDQAGATASAIAKGLVDANLLTPVGRLRVLDEKPDVVQVAPDRLLTIGLALVAAVLAGVAMAVIQRLRTARGQENVRKALTAAGIRHPVLTAEADDPALADRLALLCRAAGRSARVIAIAPDLVARAEELSDRLVLAPPARVLVPDLGDQPERHLGDAVIALTHRGTQDDLTAAVGVLPADAVLIAVVLA
jgi:capsular polysaccharide biosynthesis protein